MLYKAALPFAVFVSSLAPLAQASDYKLDCWDGSYAYNSLSVVEVDNGYEVSLKGSTLGDFQFGRTAPYVSKSWFNEQLQIKFPRSACQLKDGFIACELASPGSVHSNIFRPFVVQDLGVARIVNTIHPIDKLTLTTANGTRLAIEGARIEGEASDVQVLSFQNYSCNNEGQSHWGNTHWQPGSFAGELRAYLQQHEPASH